MSAVLPHADETQVADLAGTGSANDRVLLIEPASSRRDSLAQALRSHGFPTEAVGTVEVALELVRVWHPRLVLLDTSLLADSSLGACRQICDLAEGPTVLLGSTRELQWMVNSEIQTGHELALLGEVHSLARSIHGPESKLVQEPIGQETLEIGPIIIDQATRAVFVRGHQTARFSKLEYELLLDLVSHAGQIRTRDELLDLWGDHRPEDPKTLFVHIRRIRQKIEEDRKHPRLIITVRGMGFYFDAHAGASPT